MLNGEVFSPELGSNEGHVSNPFVAVRHTSAIVLAKVLFLEGFFKS
jgi:hypothetical protein